MPLRTLLKLALWVYAVTGTMYFLMYTAENELVLRHAVGGAWLLMMVAPLVLAVLITYPIAKRFGLLPED